MNRWKNAETHAFYNYLMNDERLYTYTAELTQDARTEPNPERYLQDGLKRILEEETRSAAGMIKDLILCAADRIDFSEIAKSLLEE